MSYVTDLKADLTLLWAKSAITSARTATAPRRRDIVATTSSTIISTTTTENFREETTMFIRVILFLYFALLGIDLLLY